VAAAGSRVTARTLSGVDDPSVSPSTWQALLRAGDVVEVFGTREWLAAWRRCYPRGELLLVLVERGGVPVLLAPLFAESGMVFFCGAGAADYLDFLGAVHDADALTAALACASRATPGFLGFRLHHVPEASRTAGTLRACACRLGFDLVQEGELDAPYVDLDLDAASERPAAHRRSLVRHEQWFRRSGSLDIVHQRHLDPGSPLVDSFFAQHVARWAQTPHPSAFQDPTTRDFHRALVSAGSEHGWLVFTTVRFNGTAVAFHLGLDFGGSLLWYKPSFAPAYARRSPGEVLLRHLLLLAAQSGRRRLDFGIGDEGFKYRFATGARRVRTWGLYPYGD
jgi:CelD/BcsL family acetyltransferase involved in cellulose biosynthesis